MSKNDGLFREEIETRQMDKFFCDEMGRQMHRYIKANGSLAMLEKLEARLRQLSVQEREEALARYIDLNRKAISGLDWRMLVARAMANFCDSYDYFAQMQGDTATMDFYVARYRGKYVKLHEVYEQNGKYGIKDHNGHILVPAEYDFLRTPYVYVDDLRTMPIIAEMNGKMGLVLPDGKGTVAAPFVYDDISLRDEEPWFELKKDGEVTLWPREK